MNVKAQPASGLAIPFDHHRLDRLMEEAGIDPVMARGTLERLERLIALNFRDIFPGEPPADYREYLPHYREVHPAGVGR